MPIYEYEPDDYPCLICKGRFEVIQEVDAPPLCHCPTCGLDVRRVISQTSFQVDKGVNPEKAAEHGFTTWRRAEQGKWEKVAGEGVDMIVGSEEDVARVEAEKEAPKKVLDLDADESA